MSTRLSRLIPAKYISVAIGPIWKDEHSTISTRLSAARFPAPTVHLTRQTFNMADKIDNLATELSDSLKINGDSNMNKDADSSNGTSDQSFPEEELYRLALRFYKGK